MAQALEGRIIRLGEIGERMNEGPGRTEVDSAGLRHKMRVAIAELGHDSIAIFARLGTSQVQCR